MEKLRQTHKKKRRGNNFFVCSVMKSYVLLSEGEKVKYGGRLTFLHVMLGLQSNDIKIHFKSHV